MSISFYFHLLFFNILFSNALALSLCVCVIVHPLFSTISIIVANLYVCFLFFSLWF